MNRSPIIIGGVLAIFAVVLMSAFVVDQRERAILFKFGEIERTDYEPGLHFKVPWYDVRVFDSRVLTFQIERQRFLTSEKKNVIVDAFVKWRIGDVSRYYTAVIGDERRAGDRLSEIVKDGLRSEFGLRTVREVVSGERDEIMQNMRRLAGDRAKELGIEIIDVRVSRIDLPPEVSNSVFDRMRAERARVASEFRSRGNAEAIRIRAQADKEKSIMLAEAQRDAERIRGEGDAKAAEIYADVFGRDAEFYAFYRSLNAYKNTFSNSNDLLVIEPDSDFFRYFGTAKTDGR
ncbi:MAG: protease modulator HflC [Gammaproteobacteria bacterium]